MREIVSKRYFSKTEKSSDVHLTNAINWNGKLVSENSFCKIEFIIVEMKD